MPHLIVTDIVAKQLHQLVQVSDDGNVHLQRLKDELADPPVPDIKDAHYEKGSTVVSHQCLINLSDDQRMSLNDLLKGARVALPIKPKAERVSVFHSIFVGMF